MGSLPVYEITMSHAMTVCPRPVYAMAFNTFGSIVLLLLLGIECSSNYEFQPNYVGDSPSDNGMRCDLTLWSQPTGKGEAAFRIKLDTNLALYVPEKKYNVYLEATTFGSKFEKFLIVAESINHSDSGSFELKNSALTTFSQNCRNTIEHTSLLPKKSIAVIWKAPSVDSGCVFIRAAVYDTLGNLYHGGNLTLKLCQGELDETVLPEILETCGACNEASYQLTFEGLWSRQTHPKDFPRNLFETSFNGIIGASHSNEFRLWEFNTNASNGIAELADTGRTKILEKELKAQSKHIRTVIKAKGLSDRYLNSKTHAMFRADDKHHLLSLIAKFFPSPDWVVGITALELCLPNNSWAASRVVNLYPVDVGTIDGATYKVDNKVRTMPREAIRQISPIDNPRSPFYSETGEIDPLAKVTVLRQRVFGKSQCITSGVHVFNGSKCAVTGWVDSGQCSCPAGRKRQKRQYKNPNDMYKKHCKVPLVREISCPCKWPPHPTITPTNDMSLTSTSNGAPFASCDTTEWSSWSECTCGMNGGISRTPSRIRRRYYKNNILSQSCVEHLVEKGDCIDAPACKGDGKCAVTMWSEWSPCNATCEMKRGMRMRTRLLHNAADATTCNVELAENETCISDTTHCDTGLQEICLQPKEIGPCRGVFDRWYYNVRTKDCERFIYGGCRGNQNNFERYSDCYKTCRDALQGSRNGFPEQSPDQVIDCKLSEWGEWSECSSTCGSAWRDRRRTVEVNAQNGGKPCVNKLYQRKKCKSLPPCEPWY